MDVRVAGHQVDTGESLREHAQQPSRRDYREIFLAFGGRQRHLREGPNNDYTCDIVAPVAQGMVLKASHSAREAQMAFNGAADRIEKQLRRYTNRLKEHKVEEGAEPFIENAGYTIFSGGGESGEQGDNPAIVAETRIDIPELSVSDAVMLMDLRNTNALMFKNSGTGEFNMIYRREDGNIGWVEPHPA